MKVGHYEDRLMIPAASQRPAHYMLDRISGDEDLTTILRLRRQTFGSETTASIAIRDDFDLRSRHLLVRDRISGKPLAAARLRNHQAAEDLLNSYAAQYYDLRPLAFGTSRFTEVGRLCLGDPYGDPNILRLLLSGIAETVFDAQSDHLIGCASFRGTAVEPYANAIALMGAQHIGPADLLPKPAARETLSLDYFGGTVRNPRDGLREMPPLLRAYLRLGAWVSDHLVIDREMNTLHVLAVLPVKSIASSLRARFRAMAEVARAA